MKEHASVCLSVCLAVLSTLCGCRGTPPGQEAENAQPFVAVSSDPSVSPAPIVVQFDPAKKTGFDYPAAKAKYIYDGSEAVKVRDAADYLQDAVGKMTGKKLEIVSTNVISQGIVLTTLDGATDDLRNDAEIKTALRNDGRDSYNDREAFYLRSETNRVLVVANNANGLLAGVAELMESVDYEVLGLGPNWVHVPTNRRDKLEFRVRRAGRPSYYIRYLGPTSGQTYGVGTIFNPRPALSDPTDEPVETSYIRWEIGARMRGQSMPGFPGHAMQAYHAPVVAKMLETKTTDGFLVEKTEIGSDSQRPSASTANTGHLWINDDTNKPVAGKVFLSDGKKWNECYLGDLGANLDLSVPMVRELIFEKLKQAAEEQFVREPNEPVILGTEPEDGGGYADLGRLLRNKNWYPDYLAKEGLPFGRPYVLNGFKELNQPKELWDPDAASDTIFGFDNWLLHELDKWIDLLPPEKRVTSTGKSKKDLLRCSGYSYNFHDVPPNFNLDPRIRVMIASYPKHRGRGKWKEYATQQDLAKAYQIMLPREPSGDYRIISLAYYWDFGLESIAPQWNQSSTAIATDLRETYAAGIKALNYETDFNFGRFGLAYYLLSKMLWNTNLTAADLDKVRDRWFQRAYGSGWKTMKAYYDFMLTDNFIVNGPNTWAQAIRLIDKADKEIAAAKELDAQRRIDDLKQFWCFYYLLDAGKGTAKAPEMKEFAWKGQMSYMTAMHVVMRRIFGVNSPVEAVGSEISKGPAHYTHEETQAWWDQILEHWPLVPVTSFSDAALANGRKGKDVDLNDLVAVKEFGDSPAPQGFIYNSGYMKPPTFLCVAGQTGEEIGFKLFWPADPTGKDGYYIARDLPYGIDIWNPQSRKWDAFVDKTMIRQPSVQFNEHGTGRPYHLVEVRVKAPRPGTYRFDIGYGGNLSTLTDLSYDVTTGKFGTPRPFAFSSSADGLTQAPVYIYIPKGTRSLDLEVSDSYNAKKVTIFKGMPPQAPTPSRKVDISARATHRVAIEPGEDGTIAMIEGNGFVFPYLYSVPAYWAKAPSQLVVPRAIAEADGLTIVK